MFLINIEISSSLKVLKLIDCVRCFNSYITIISKLPHLLSLEYLELVFRRIEHDECTIFDVLSRIPKYVKYLKLSIYVYKLDLDILVKHLPTSIDYFEYNELRMYYSPLDKSINDFAKENSIKLICSGREYSCKICNHVQSYHEKCYVSIDDKTGLKVYACLKCSNIVTF